MLPLLAAMIRVAWMCHHLCRAIVMIQAVIWVKVGWQATMLKCWNGWTLARRVISLSPINSQTLFPFWCRSSGPEAGETRYCVKIENHHTGQFENHYADHVIVAAGTVNMLHLLLHSRNGDEDLGGIPQLGKTLATMAIISLTGTGMTDFMIWTKASRSFCMCV